MPYPTVDWNKIASDVRSAFTSNGTPADFTLTGGTSFTVPVTQGRLADTDITGGLDQTGFRLRVHADDWDNAAPREPRKGDKVTIWGRKYSIHTAWLRSADNRGLVYVIVVQG